MKISGIDFPQPLLNALRDSRLVVFAGAGVSMGDPASLPSFKTLAREIAQGTGKSMDGHEPEDRFLGRLQHQGVNIHERAVEVLSKDSSKPTCLHRNLLRLYSTSQAVRIVTTNFDTLFEQAAEAVDGMCDPGPQIFKAPALPLGTEFNGIVHVHGALDHPHDMVLTDGDFGRAYLTEGWARRFLIALFRSFTVLFIGYSHNDIVMTYLARALPPSENRHRFVLTDEEDDSKWKLLGIVPIVYPRSPGDNHCALQKGIRGLAEYASRGILDWQREITEIAEKPPSFDAEAMALIDDALSDPTRTGFFTRAASHPEWIEWLEKRNHVGSLFVDNLESLCSRDRQLARWLTERFVCKHSDKLFLLIERNGLRLHRDFWTELGRTIRLAQDPPLAANTLAQWVSLLLATAPPTPDSHVLLWLGERCAEAGLTDSLVDIFHAMAASHFALSPGLASTAKGSQVQDHYDMNSLWEETLKPNLDQVAKPLLVDVVRHLAHRHRTFCVWQSVSRDSDFSSLNRSAIEPHEQDTNPESIDVLIDVARDCLAYLAAEQPEAAAHWCDELVREQSPLLRRLAVHTLPVRQDLTANEKIDWLLTGIGLHELSAHHETFQAVRTIYPCIGAEQRKAVITEIFAHVWPIQEEDDKERYAAYSHFRWLNWLHNSDPSCNLAEQALKELQQRYPDFQPGEHPDLTHYITAGWVRPKSPWSVEELVSRPGSQWLDALLRWHEQDLLGPNRKGLLCAVEEAATKQFEWGLDLADALADSDHWDADLWSSLLPAWSRELDANKHRAVLDRLSGAALDPKHARAVADMLRALVKDGGMPYAPILLSEANQLAIALWGCLDQDKPPLQMDDWLMQAINHPAGILAQFWLESLRLWGRQQDPLPDTLGDEYASVYLRIVQDKTLAGRLGKTVLARELGFILAADENWAKEHVIPLFEHTNDDDCRAVWHGFIYGSLSPQVANALEHAFLKAVPCMKSLFPNGFPHGGRFRDQFIRRYMVMVAYFVEEPIALWIPKFFAHADAEDRGRFAWHIGQHLKSMDDARQQEWWTRWLRQYWENRLQGIPPGPPTAREVEAMLGWLPHLQRLFPEAVEFAIQMPEPQLEHSSIVYDLNQSDLWSNYPEATVKLLIYIANSESSIRVWLDGNKLIQKLLQLDLPQDLKTGLREIPVKLGLGTDSI